MWDDARQLNATAATLAVLAIAALAWGALSWIARAPVFELREVVVGKPLERANAAHLETVIRNELAGTFFTMNLDRARAAIAKVAWVRAVSLRRQWPRRLEVDIDEHTPLARWNDRALVDIQGDVFAADSADELPLFEGPDGRAAEIADRYREWTATLAPLGLSLAEIRLSARGSWHVRAVAGGAPLDIELGRDDPSARLARFAGMFARTLGVLGRAGTSIAQVDLRYRNGFAARVPGFRERPPKKAA
ncbi:MAG: cell division protein FtsQ/DivIB [Telluria sp.]